MDQAQVFTNEKDDSSLGKGQQQDGEEFANANYIVTADAKFQFDMQDLDLVARKLKQRHVQMYAYWF
jgi:hypothetical protein